MWPQDVVPSHRFLVRFPRRRFRVGDLLTGIAIAALCLAAINGSDLFIPERSLLGLFAVAFLASLRAQWALADMQSIVMHPASAWSWVSRRSSLIYACSFA